MLNFSKLHIPVKQTAGSVGRLLSELQALLGPWAIFKGIKLDTSFLHLMKCFTTWRIKFLVEMIQVWIIEKLSQQEKVRKVFPTGKSYLFLIIFWSYFLYKRSTTMLTSLYSKISIFCEISILIWHYFPRLYRT